MKTTQSSNHIDEMATVLRQFTTQEALFDDDDQESIELTSSDTYNVFNTNIEEIQDFAKNVMKALNSNIGRGNLTVNLNVNVFVTPSVLPTKPTNRSNRVIVVRPPEDSNPIENSKTSIPQDRNAVAPLPTDTNQITAEAELPRIRHRPEALTLPPTFQISSPSPRTPHTPLPSIPEQLSPTTTEDTATTRKTPETPQTPGASMNEILTPLSTPLLTPTRPRNQRQTQGQGQRQQQGQRQRNRRRSNSTNLNTTQDPRSPGSQGPRRTSFRNWYDGQRNGADMHENIWNNDSTINNVTDGNTLDKTLDNAFGNTFSNFINGDNGKISNLNTSRTNLSNNTQTTIEDNPITTFQPTRLIPPNANTSPFRTPIHSRTNSNDPIRIPNHSRDENNDSFRTPTHSRNNSSQDASPRDVPQRYSIRDVDGDADRRRSLPGGALFWMPDEDFWRIR